MGTHFVISLDSMIRFNSFTTREAIHTRRERCVCVREREREQRTFFANEAVIPVI